jgi:hypothetical protein
LTNYIESNTISTADIAVIFPVGGEVIQTGKTIKIPKIKVDSNIEVKIDSVNLTVSNNQAGFGLIYNLSEEYHEVETLEFKAFGQFETSDGKKIDFNYQIFMSREFSYSNSLEIRIGDAVKKDPIIVNLGDKTISFKNEKIDFDLDGDGEHERLSMLDEGFAFLAIDKNHDGKINNGLELFGPKTGNGFSELKDLDNDKNNWIDERDNIFNDLRSQNQVYLTQYQNMFNLIQEKLYNLKK